MAAVVQNELDGHEVAMGDAGDNEELVILDPSHVNSL